MGFEGEVARLAANLEQWHAQTAGIPDRVKELEVRREQCELLASAHGDLSDSVRALDARVRELERLHGEAARAIEKAGEKRWSVAQMVYNAALTGVVAWILWKLGVTP